MMKTIEFIAKELDDHEIELVMNQPTYKDREEADKIYSAKIASLVRENGDSKLLLRSEIDNFLKKNRIWTNEDDDKINDLNSSINKMFNTIRKGGIKLTEGRSLCIKIMDARKEIFNIMNKRRIFEDSTIEAKAEREREDYLIFSCTKKKDGQKYWLTFDDMKDEKNSDIYLNSSAKLYELLYGQNGEFEKNLPENKWLKKYNFIDENLNYLDRKTGEKVDRDGNTVKQIEDTIKENINNLAGEIIEENPFIDE